MPTIIQTRNDFLSRTAFNLSDSSYQCQECGRVHTIPIRWMETGSDLAVKIPNGAQRELGHLPSLTSIIYDQVIADLVTENVVTPLRALKIACQEVPVGDGKSILDSEVGLGNHLADYIQPETEMIIGVGSGVICDLTKWVATRKKIPYFLFATAPSMNGYTSITATMTEADIKTSRLLDPAAAVFMDIDLQAQAPLEMIFAGMGDLAARSICNADWKLSNLVRGTYFCSLPFEMTAKNQALVLAEASAITRRDPLAMADFSEAVLMSGLSMTVLDGETSPSSGAEHVISHFWDLLTHIRGLPRNLHGTQVGVGTVMLITLYEIMREVDVQSIDPLALLRKRPSVEHLESENNQLYGEAGALFNAVVRKKRVPDDHFCEYVRGIQKKWDAMWDAVTPYLTDLNTVRTPLHHAGIPLSLSSISRSSEEAVEALIKGPQYRARYTMLDMASELGLLPDIAGEVLSRSGVLSQ